MSRSTRPEPSSTGTWLGTASTRHPAASADRTPVLLSSIATAVAGSIPSSAAAFRYGSGCGLPCVHSSPATVTVNGAPLWAKPLNSLFLSVTARTAGFNNIDYTQAADSSNFLTILLMSIGGSPGSTAGGLKTTTVAIIGLLAWAAVTDRPLEDGLVEVRVYRDGRIPPGESPRRLYPDMPPIPPPPAP